MSKIFAFDTEDNSKGKPLLFNFYDIEKENHTTFKNQIEALDFVCSHPKATYWAVNLEYDINNLFRNYFRLLHYSFAGSRLIVAELRDDKIKFYNTLSHWQISVKGMGDRIGLPKLDMPPISKVTEKLITYCRRDTEITGKFVKSMMETYNTMGVPMKPTLASSTLRYFENEFHGKLVNPFNQKQIDFFHRGYTGGRAEIFHCNPVEGTIRYADVNSLYPFCLAHESYPVLHSYYETNHPRLEREGMVECTLWCPKNILLPYLPVRHASKLVFPTGRIKGHFSYFEIREALQLGYRLDQTGAAIEFDSTERPFRRFVETLYENRKHYQSRQDELGSMTCKLLMNSLYGKFAQSNEVVKLIPLESAKLKSGDKIFGDLVFRKEKIKYAPHANCIWSAYTTAYARHVLYRDGLLPVVKSGGLLLYCDTDSVIYESSKEIIPSGTELGKFKSEGNYQYAHFKLPKLYTLVGNEGSTFRAKGVPQKEAESFFTTGKAKFRRPNRLRETLRRNLSPKRVRDLVPNYWEVREKEISSKYDKRVVFSDGSTAPIHLN